MENKFYWFGLVFAIMFIAPVTAVIYSSPESVYADFNYFHDPDPLPDPLPDHVLEDKDVLFNFTIAEEKSEELRVSLFHRDNQTMSLFKNSSTFIEREKLNSFGTFSNGYRTFDGIDDYINLGKQNHPTDSITVSAMVKFNDLTKDTKIISCTQTGGFAMDVNSPSGNNAFSIYLGGSYKTPKIPISSLQEGVVYSFVGTYDGSSVKLYVNGVLMDSVAASGKITYHSTAPTLIGAEPDATKVVGNYFNGSIDDVRIYDKALTQDEVYMLYTDHSGLHEFDNRLVLYTSFDNSTDLGGGTNYGSTWATNFNSGNEFGSAVDIYGNYAVVGFWKGGNPDTNHGEAFVFERDEYGKWKKLQELKPSDLPAEDLNINFGSAVSIYGNYIAVSAVGDDEGKGASGAVYIFERDANNVWREIQKIKANPIKALLGFGNGIDMNDKYMVSGAPLFDNSAYIFERTDSGYWAQVKKISTNEKNFGYNVAVSENYIAISAYRSNISVSDGGAVFIYKRNDSGDWNYETALTPSDISVDDRFGYDVAMDGDYLVASSTRENTLGDKSGAVYVFERNSSGYWNEVQKLLPDFAVATDYFGSSVSINGDYIAIGSEDGAENRGSVFIFKKNGDGVWVQVQKIRGKDTAPDDNFGSSEFRQVSISGDFIIVGAVGNDELATNSGAAYIFEKLSSQAAPYFTFSETLNYGCYDGEYTILDGAGNSNTTNSYFVIKECSNHSDCSGEGNDFCQYYNEGDENAVCYDAKGDYGMESMPVELAKQWFCAPAKYMNRGTAAVSWDLGNLNEAYSRYQTDSSDSDSWQFEGDGMATAKTSYTTQDDDLCFIYNYNPCSLSSDSNVALKNADGTRYDLGNITQGLPITLGCSDNWIWIDLSPYLGSSDGHMSTALFSGGSDSVSEWRFGWLKDSKGDFSNPTNNPWCCGSSTDCVFNAPEQGNRISGNPVAGGPGTQTIESREKFEFTQSDGDPINDGFGYSIDIDGDYAVVGTPYYGESNSGSAYIFKRNSSGAWNEVQKILPNNPMEWGYFGQYVAISGNTVIISGNKLNLDDFTVGAVYIFERNSSDVWNQKQELMSTQVCDFFGSSIDIDGNYMVVGSNGEGSATIFERNSGGVWNEVKKIFSEYSEPPDSYGECYNWYSFGSAVTISGNFAIIGDGEDYWDNRDERNVVHILERDGSGSWNLAQTLKGTKFDGSFGRSVAISGNFAIIGTKRAGGEEHVVVKGTDRKTYSVSFYDDDLDPLEVKWLVDNQEKKKIYTDVNDYFERTDTLTYSFGCGVSGAHTVEVKISDGIDTTTKKWYVDVIYVECEGGD